MKQACMYLFYFLYRVDYRIHLGFNKINPIRRFLDEGSKSMRKNKGRDVSSSIDDAFGNRDYGISIMRSGGFLVFLFWLFLYGFQPWVYIYTGYKAYLDLKLQLAILAVIFLVCQLAFFRTKINLEWFDRFDHLDGRLKTRRDWFCALTIFLTFAFALWGFSNLGGD